MTWYLLWITSMGNHGLVGSISDHRRFSCSSCTYAYMHHLDSMIYLILTYCRISRNKLQWNFKWHNRHWIAVEKIIDTYCWINFQTNTPNITLLYFRLILCPKSTSRSESFKLPFLSLFLNFRLAFWFHPLHLCLIILILIKVLMKMGICQYNFASTHWSLVT